VVGSVFTIAPEIIRFLISSKVVLIKAKKTKKGCSKKKTGSEAGYMKEGMPSKQKF